MAIWQYSAFGPPEQTFSHLIKLLDQDAQNGSLAQIYCLPEMALTGFRYKNLGETAAQSPDFITELSKLAIKYMTAFSLTLAWPRTDLRSAMASTKGSSDSAKVADSPAITNRHVFVSPEGVSSYDKVHLIGFGGFSEDRFFAPGRGPAEPVPYRGWNIGLSVCYDLRFPELFRAMAGADLFLLPAQWPTARHEHMKILSQARAVENQAFMAVTNCTGRHGKLQFKGESRLIGPRGKMHMELGSDEELRSFVLDKEELTQLRAEMPVLDDRRL